MTLTAAVDQLKPTFTGDLLLPAGPGYDEARRVHNGYIDKRPALIARCKGMEIAVRGGGHNVGGRGTVDGGHRALPRRGHTRSRGGDRVHHAADRLQRPGARAVE